MSEWASSNKNSAISFLMGFMMGNSWAQCHNWTLKELYNSAWRGLLETCPGFLQILFAPSFPFLIVLCVHRFAVNHHGMSMCYQFPEAHTVHGQTRRWPSRKYSMTLSSAVVYTPVTMCSAFWVLVPDRAIVNLKPANMSKTVTS